ncbi:hypothetical protein LVD17_28135 [Fulvivirga ulvae]|uniref:AAA domain-containing protein n=1 Tax=Fulvivirga ulvae TaxID=2904245 RepID=UPI001F270B34|nr:AAA domain-containing protein [Fulvivirga ulvae]UII32158.1 hypothetical protein LVD17_28135 [Fulvivirga ulvae]
MEEYSNVLACWHKLEHFSPASLPKESSELVTPEPWTRPLKASSEAMTLEYTIYLGITEQAKVNVFIKEFFRDRNEEPNQRSNRLCTASLKLDEQGRYKGGSLGISTLPWALGQLKQGKLNAPNWVEAFHEVETKVESYLEDLLNAIKGDQNNGFIEEVLPMDISMLLALSGKISKEVACPLELDQTIYITAQLVRKSKNVIENSSADLLNSFYIRDLERLMDQFEPKKSPKAFLDYLKGCMNHINTRRTDLSKDISLIKEVLKPENYPDGCWPSAFKLSLMQQFAVNTIFNNLSGANQSGIYSVNGPPGTGKTTLLRDVIAPIIVKRAKALSKIEDPEEALSEMGRVTISENYSPYIYQLDKNLTRGGILIASSNNGAVENISKELPLKAEIEPYEKDVSYFKEVAESCLDNEYWGIIAAILGNSDNRSKLVNSLWFKENNLREILKNNHITQAQWHEAVADFRRQQQLVDQERETLKGITREYEHFLDVKDALYETTSRYKVLQEQQRELDKEVESLLSKVNGLKRMKSNTLNELSVVKAAKPGFFTYWFNRHIRRAYNETLEKVILNYNSLVKDLEIHEGLCEESKLKASGNLEELNKHEGDLEKLERQNELLETKTREAREYLGNSYADEEFWLAIETKLVQEACPWYSDKFKQLQSELFISSMKLHEKFILRANSTNNGILHTMAAFFEYLKGTLQVTKQQVKAMFDTFFLVIPVVSSTFASIQSMLRDLDKEDIPWLFIDEAGQAVPQAAAGAVWRSQRVAVVGDPLQIEPVVTIAPTLTNNISKYYNLTKENINNSLSVQVLADRINPLGATLSSDDAPVWVGIPLLVHRRCLSPMFDIANSIAYANTMYQSTPVTNPNILFETNFIHCTGEVEGRHFVSNQATVIKRNYS